MAGKRRRYTDDFRASAVLMLEAAGYTGDQETSKVGSLTAVSNKLSVPLSTLRRWFIAQQNPPPADLVIDKKVELVDMIDNEMQAIYHEWQDARKEAPYNHLATAWGILFDKRQLLTGGPTSNENRRILVKYADAAD